MYGVHVQRNFRANRCNTGYKSSKAIIIYLYFANFINNNKPQQPISQNHYKDITNSKEMTERSFDILQQRYKDGLISIEEFSRKCEQLRNRK